MKKFRKFIQRAMVVLVAAATVFQAVPVIAFAEEETAEAETTIGIEAEEAEEPVDPSGTESREDAIIMAVDAYLDGVTEDFVQ